MSSILLARQISKTFLLRGKRLLILSELDFELDEYEFVSIIGSSGCGKSTFLELLAGISLPDGGEIKYKGKSIIGKSGILGYMPQDDLLLPWLSVLDNSLLPIRIKGRLSESAQNTAIKLAIEFGLENHLSHHPWQLSGGLKQRAAFLRTCMTGADVLLLDEPFANLDAITRNALQDWLKDVKQKLGLTIILVTHDIEEALKLSNRIVPMTKNPGKMLEAITSGAFDFSDKNDKSTIKNLIMRALVS